MRLLKQYCDTQFPAEDNGVAFADLISSWSYAGESNNDSVLSAVPAVLAQFLGFISSYLEFSGIRTFLVQVLTPQGPGTIVRPRFQQQQVKGASHIALP